MSEWLIEIVLATMINPISIIWSLVTCLIFINVMKNYDKNIIYDSAMDEPHYKLL